MACVAGCTIENGTETPLNWRVVNTHNKIKHPDLPVFHFSLACNHCEDAPCMKNCPALAYTRDPKTGAIIHHAEACIGCTYCTWACPYDAPKFNPKTKIVEKCNFCVDRISEGRKPACVEACPVGALDFSQQEISTEERITPGFVNVGIKPSIVLNPLREAQCKPQIENLDAAEISPDKMKAYLPDVPSKISLKKEWTLVLFTLSVAGLVAWQAAGSIYQTPVSPLWFMLLAVMAIVLTSFHVGKKLRMWRFILNLKNSWLSREIFLFSAFLGLSGLYFHTGYDIFVYLSVCFGIASIISVDMLYQFLKRKDHLLFHSAMVSITVLFFFAWISGNIILISFISLMKLVLYIGRKVKLHQQKQNILPLLSGLRILGICLPLVMIYVAPQLSVFAVLAILMVGEIIDRSEFYYESGIISPQSELAKFMVKEIWKL